MLNLNFNVEPHKYLEVIRGDDTIIVLYSDDGSTIEKEVHTFSNVTAADAVGFLTAGMVIETVTNFTATGSWDERYELDYYELNYTDNAGVTSEEEETPTEEETPVEDTPSEPENVELK